MSKRSERKKRIPKDKMEEEDDDDDDLVKSYLTQSMEDIPIYRARYTNKIDDRQRTELILNELSLVKKKVDQKRFETDCKARWYQGVNNIFSFAIIACSATIIGLQAASDCINIPVIVLSSVIFLVESLHKLFRWGPQGVLMKYGSIQLRRIGRQCRGYMYQFHKYTIEQLLTLIDQLYEQYDDIDATLYSSSVSGPARFNTGLDIEEGGGASNIPSALKHRRHHHDDAEDSDKRESSPHVHIHLDQASPYIPAPPEPEKRISTPILVLPSASPKKIRSSLPANLSSPDKTEVSVNIPTITIDDNSESYGPGPVVSGKLRD